MPSINRIKFKHGDILVHFKHECKQNILESLYEFICHAEHTENKGMYVVYKSLYTNKIYVRPMKMFYSEVNKTKYKHIKQKYRFELYSKSENTTMTI